MRALSLLTCGILPLCDCLRPRLQKLRADKEAGTPVHSAERDTLTRHRNLAAGQTAEGQPASSKGAAARRVDVVFTAPPAPKQVPRPSPRRMRPTPAAGAQVPQP